METGLLHTHNLLRYILLILLLASVGRAFAALLSKKAWGKLDNKLGLYTLLVAHLQLVLGLVIYGVLGYQKYLGSLGEHISDPNMRFKILEHPVTMILAIVLITMGRARGKRATTDARKHRLTGIFFAIALVLILSRMPNWGFPGM